MEINIKAFILIAEAPACRDPRRNAPLLLAFGISAIGLLAHAVHAQTVASRATSASSNADVIEEIVVTARRQTERLQEVPLAITAFTSDMLDKAGVKTLEDLSRLTPGLTINTSGAEAGVAPTIRGQTHFSSGGDPNVGIFLDGVYLANSSARKALLSGAHSDIP